MFKPNTMTVCFESIHSIQRQQQQNLHFSHRHSNGIENWRAKSEWMHVCVFVICLIVSICDQVHFQVTKMHRLTTKEAWLVAFFQFFCSFTVQFFLTALYIWKKCVQLQNFYICFLFIVQKIKYIGFLSIIYVTE